MVKRAAKTSPALQKPHLRLAGAIQMLKLCNNTKSRILAYVLENADEKGRLTRMSTTIAAACQTDSSLVFSTLKSAVAEGLLEQRSKSTWQLTPKVLVLYDSSSLTALMKKK